MSTHDEFYEAARKEFRKSGKKGNFEGVSIEGYANGAFILYVDSTTGETVKLPWPEANVPLEFKRLQY